MVRRGFSPVVIPPHRLRLPTCGQPEASVGASDQTPGKNSSHAASGEGRVSSFFFCRWRSRR